MQSHHRICTDKSLQHVHIIQLVNSCDSLVLKCQAGHERKWNMGGKEKWRMGEGE